RLLAAGCLNTFLTVTGTGNGMQGPGLRERIRLLSSSIGGCDGSGAVAGVGSVVAGGGAVAAEGGAAFSLSGAQAGGRSRLFGGDFVCVAVWDPVAGVAADRGLS